MLSCWTPVGIGYFYAIVLMSTSIIMAKSDYVAQPVPRGYGQPCTCDADCDQDKFLLCKDQICSCSQPESLVYDNVNQSCVIRVGHKCYSSGLSAAIRCKHGAFCSISSGGICICNSYGFYQDLSGQCVEKKSYGVPCSRNIECMSDSCSAKFQVCDCKEGQYFHKRKQRCISHTGSVCFKHEECTDHALCNDITAKCECPSGAVETASLTCVIPLRYGAKCNVTYPCNQDELSCLDGKCGCKFKHQYYSQEDGGSCINKYVLDTPCFSNRNCPENSFCEDDETEVIGHCTCSPGYLPDVGGETCSKLKSLEEPCSTTAECDPLGPLVCKDFKCRCQDEREIFDPVVRLCLAIPGVVCKENPGKDSFQCIEGASCVQNNPKLPSLCMCDGHFIFDPIRKLCLPAPE